MSKPLGVGMIGYRFMGKAHSHAYRDAGFYFNLTRPLAMRAICGRNEEAVAAAAQRWGWESYETDWRRLLERNDIDIIDVSSPGNTHYEIVMAAAKAGKHIICEKPLANTLAEGEEMLAAVKAAGVKHMVAFNVRRIPAVALAKQWISEGLLGDIYLFRGTYLQDFIVDPEFPLVWRLQKDMAGSGPLGDLAAHTIDLAHYLVGDISEVCGITKTFITERPLAEAMDDGLGATGKSGAKGKVDVEDAAMFMAHFSNGALGSFEATRFATGNSNANCIEINGSKGAIKWSIERLNEIQLYLRSDAEGQRGWRTVLVSEDAHPYIKAYWPAGHFIGWEHSFIHEIYDFAEAIANDTSVQPSFVDGVKCQAVIEAVQNSANAKQWVDVKKIKA
ncbi:MAG TPA: Gfo/Idh/MocA family oxidoreductase [Firmicutes bacterium]|jgi:predicted dehydrogenase|nr:Gfo/Idh/MocA family oxidoreductase [Bacillota bacterium]